MLSGKKILLGIKGSISANKAILLVRLFVKSGAEVKEIVIRDLQFNANLQFGYQKRTELEPDLLDA